MNRQELSAASAIGLLYLIRMVGLFMILPVLPILGPDIEGATPLLIGIGIGIYGLSQGLLQIPFGLLSDRYGRKRLIAIGLMFFIAGSFIAGTAENIGGLIVGRFLQGCGAIASTLLALMADLTRVDQRSKSMAIIGISIAGSFGLSLILGPVVAAKFGISGIFYLTGGLGILGLGVLTWQIPSPKVLTTNLDSSVQQGKLLTVVRDLNLWRLNVSVFFLHFLLVSAFSVFPLLFNATGQINQDEHGTYYLVLLLISFVLMLPFMWLADRMSDVRPVLITMVSLCLLAFYLLADSTDYVVVLIGVVLFFMAFNLLEVVLPAQVSKMSSAGSRGTSMGVYTSCQFFGIFAGGLVSGWILMVSDITTLMYANIGLVLVWLGICVTVPRLGNLGSRTIQLAQFTEQTAHERVEELLSVAGVIDAVIIESEQVAYLKVDEQVFEDQHLDQISNEK
jgi:MFS family permease